MARESPAQKIARIRKVTAAWQALGAGSVFFGHTLAQFKKAVRPSHSARAEIADLEGRLSRAIKRRDVADARSLGLMQGVVEGVKGDPRHGHNGALYSAMGYVRKSARRKGRRKKK
ncbi:MAG: hypothetical protein WDO56_13675 [Gammaproteobacteria bacterium]